MKTAASLSETSPTGTGIGPQPAASQEYALLDHAVRLERNIAGRLALHVHLSRLSGQNQRGQQIETAVAQFEEMVARVEGKTYRIMSGDIIFVGDGDRAEDLDNAVLHLRQMFSADPVTGRSDDDPESGFCSSYVLERDYPQFIALTRQLFETSEAHRHKSQKVENEISGPGVLGSVGLTPAQLGKLEEALANADLSALMRLQPVCAVTPDDAPEIVFHEMFVSIDDLGRTLLPGVSITSDPWLFQRLTRTLDDRVLRQVTHDYSKTEKAFSLNLNVATVLSSDFRRFEQKIGLGVRGRLIIEFQHVDVISDMPAYLFAREYLREVGFKVCIDGLNHMTLPFVDRERLGLDLLKMYWSDDQLAGMGADAITALEQAVRNAGVARIIMCRCESERALKIGHNMGISLYQGRHIDALLAQKS